MGREIRRVPPNWVHPKFHHDYTGESRDQPMYDRKFEADFADWLSEFDRFRRDDLSSLDRECYPRGLADWLLDDGRPIDPKYYRPWGDGEATWFQLWQTVSEGTPVSPPFETIDELTKYLADNGDFWDQKRCDPPWGQERAEAFCKVGWAPSFVVYGGKVYSGTEVA